MSDIQDDEYHGLGACHYVIRCHSEKLDRFETEVECERILCIICPAIALLSKPSINR